MSDDMVFLSVPLHTSDPQVRAIYAIQFIMECVGPLPLSKEARIAVLRYHLERAQQDGPDNPNGTESK